MAEPIVDLGLLDKSGVQTLHCRSGEVIFNEGEVASAAYVLRSGEVELRRGDHVFERAQPGTMFGEMAVIDPNERSAKATALTDVELYPIEKRTFLHLIGEQPTFAINVLRLLCHRIRREDMRSNR